MEVKQRKHHHGGLMWISILELVIIFACSILLSVVRFRKLPSSMKTSSQTIKPKICFTCIILCSCKLQQQETGPSEICLNTVLFLFLTSYFQLTMRNKSLSFAVYVPKHNDFSIRERQSCSQHFSQLTRDDMCQLSDLQTVQKMPCGNQDGVQLLLMSDGWVSQQWVWSRLF